MSKITIGRSGHSYTLNGQAIAPRELVFANGFKCRNHIAAWIMGKGGQHLDNFKRYIEDWRKIGIRGFRIPVELKFWGPPYFDHPQHPNERCFLDLSAPTGSGFYLTSGFKKQIRMLVNIAREMDVVLEIPWLWTVKGNGEGDPREDVSGWNEHYIANVGRYLRKLRTEGDGEGEHRVDPGGLNILSELANEYRAHADIFTEQQLRNIFRRWHKRDCPGELLGVSEAGSEHEYHPPLDLGSESPDDIRLHPTRNGDWWNSPGEIWKKFWKFQIPLFMNETILHMTQSQWNHWIPKVPKWHGLATTDTNRYMKLHRGFWDRGIYTTLHTMRGMDGGWPASVPGKLEELLAEELKGTSPPKHKFQHVIEQAYEEILKRPADDPGIANYDELMSRGMSESDLRNTLMRSKEFDEKFGGVA